MNEKLRQSMFFPGDVGAVVLQVPSGGGAAALLGGQQGLPHAGTGIQVANLTLIPPPFKAYILYILIPNLKCIIPSSILQ